MSKNVVWVLTLLALSTLVISAFGSIQFANLPKEFSFGDEVVIEEHSSYDKNWEVRYPNGTIYTYGVGNTLKFTVPKGVDKLDIILTAASKSGCLAQSVNEIIVNPPEIVSYDVTVRTEPVIETFTVEVPPISCGIDGAIEAGPTSTSEVYKYAGGSKGPLDYEWILDGDVVSHDEGVSIIKDLKLNWATYSEDSPYDGTNKTVSLHISRDANPQIPPENRTDDKILQDTTCYLAVMVYPPLKVNIIGPGEPLICSEAPNATFTYEGEPLSGLAYVWSINDKILEGKNDARIEIDFSDPEIIPGYGTYVVNLDVTRTTPGGLKIVGHDTEKVTYEETPAIPGAA